MSAPSGDYPRTPLSGRPRHFELRWLSAAPCQAEFLPSWLLVSAPWAMLIEGGFRPIERRLASPVVACQPSLFDKAVERTPNRFFVHAAFRRQSLSCREGDTVIVGVQAHQPQDGFERHASVIGRVRNRGIPRPFHAVPKVILADRECGIGLAGRDRLDDPAAGREGDLPGGHSARFRGRVNPPQVGPPCIMFTRLIEGRARRHRGRAMRPRQPAGPCRRIRRPRARPRR